MGINFSNWFKNNNRENKKEDKAKLIDFLADRVTESKEVMKKPFPEIFGVDFKRDEFLSYLFTGPIGVKEDFIEKISDVGAMQINDFKQILNKSDQIDGKSVNKAFNEAGIPLKVKNDETKFSWRNGKCYYELFGFLAYLTFNFDYKFVNFDKNNLYLIDEDGTKLRMEHVYKNGNGREGKTIRFEVSNNELSFSSIAYDRIGSSKVPKCFSVKQDQYMEFGNEKLAVYEPIEGDALEFALAYKPLAKFIEDTRKYFIKNGLEDGLQYIEPANIRSVFSGQHELRKENTINFPN